MRPLMPSPGSAGKRQQRFTIAEPDDTKSTPPTGINRQLGLSQAPKNCAIFEEC